VTLVHSQNLTLYINSLSSGKPASALGLKKVKGYKYQNMKEDLRGNKPGD
jgi:hypothetical protein